MDNNPSKKPGWKKGGGPEKAPVGPARAWQKERGAAGAPAGMGRKVKLLGSLTGFFILLALLFWFIQWLLAGKKTALVLVVAGYETNLTLPHNATGRQGAEALRDMADKKDPNGNQNFTSYSPPTDFKHKADWQPAEKLAEMKEGVLLLVFSVHGVSDGPRNYFLRDGGSPWDLKAQHLDLEEVLTVLEGVPHKKKKVLVLDVVHNLSHWPTGQIHNDFVRNLKRLNDRIKSIPNLVVLCSTDVDQRSWQSPEWGRSVYLHYLLEGLKGSADLNKHGEITALELHEFLTSRTKRWVFDNRATLQTPILLPDGDDGKNRASEVTLAPAVGYREPEKPAVVAFKPDGLKDTWDKWYALRNSQPAPWAYSPHLWKLYSQAVLRYEELLLVGSSFAASARSEADKYHDALAGLRAVTLDAQGFALPLAAVGGVVAPKPLRDKVKELAARLRAEPSQKTWDEISKDLPPADRGLLVQELHRYFLKEFVQKARDLRTGVLPEVLQRLEVNRGVRPTEVHFARMLALPTQFTDKDTDDKNNLLLEALRHRIRAEEIALAFDVDNRTYPYAEQVRPWIEGRMATGDEARRHAEDWLFANNWNTATSDYVSKVEAQYGRLEEDVRRLRRALAVRDQALADLPWLSFWLAALDSTDEAKSNDQVNAAHKLWEALHDLDLALAETPNANPPALGDQINRIDGLAGDVRKGLDRFIQDYRQQVNSLLTEKDTPRNLHALVALTAVPLLESDQRTRLAEKVRQMSGILLRNTDTSDTNDTKIDSSGAAKDFPLQARQRVARNGKLLLAYAGKQHMPGEYEQYSRVGVPTETVFSEASQAGPRIRAAWQRLGDDVDSLLKGLPSRNLAGCRQDLLKAEKLGRHLSLASAPLFTKPDYNPGALARQLRLYDLLVWQTRRTQQDFWNWEIKQANPYYVDAGKRYLTDARKRLSELPEGVTTQLKEERVAEVLALETLLDGKPKLQLDGLPSGAPPTLHITSELEYDLDFRLKVHQDVPRGYPYTTFVIKEPELLTQNVQDKRSVAKVEKGTDVVPLQLRLNNELLAKQSANNITGQTPPRRTTEVKLSSWFRGHVDDPSLNVVMYPFASNVHADEPPQTGTGLTVYGKGLKRFSPNNSGLVLVLDCSGSMVSKDTVDDSGLNRFERIRKVLPRLLASIPEDTQFSLWIYGQATPKATKESLPLEARGEATIHRLFGKKKWKPSMREEVDTLVKSIDPGFFTPVTRSIYEASADLAEWESGQQTGFATLVVLTDGMDTCFKRDPEFDRNASDPVHNPNNNVEIADFLANRFRDSKITLRVVCYQVSDKPSSVRPKSERAIALEQFGPLVQRLPGKFFLDFVDDLEDLSRKLIEGSQQRLKYTFRETISDRTVKEGVLPEIRPAPTPLENGAYKVLIHGPRTYSQRVNLENGDSLTLRVVEDKGDLRIIRDPLTDELGDRPPPLELRREGGEHWLLTNLRNKRVTTPPGQAILVTLNRADQASRAADEELTVMAPGFVWMELKGAQSEKTPLRLKWGRTQGMPAPSWELDATWATPADVEEASRLAVWVSSSRPQAVPGSLEKGIHWNLGTMGDPAPRPKEWDRFFDGKVKIESVRRETHLIRFGPDQRPEKRECLVVRASYEGEPVFVEPQGFRPPALHHYYTDARKYTGYFLLSKGQAEAVGRFNLYSLEGFKKHAQTLNGTLKLDKPRSDDAEPDTFRRLRTPSDSGS